MRGPRYGSPGVWEIGDLEPGEVITLTYEAEVVDEEYTGEETDLAWASAVDPEDASLVFSNNDNQNPLISSSDSHEADSSPQTDQPPTDESLIKLVFIAKTKYLLSIFWNFINRLVRVLL